MEIEIIKKLIEAAEKDHKKFIKDSNIAEKYFRNKNDILEKKSPSNNNQNTTDNPLRNADNRISHNFHGLLVNQKAAYVLTYPPTFDVGDEAMNENIGDILGDEFPKESKSLCVDASNAGRAWVHVWIDESNQFQYAHVDPKQIIPIYSNDLKKRLIAVLRTYETVDDKGETYTIYEYWTDSKVYAYKNPKSTSVATGLKYANIFKQVDTSNGEEELFNKMNHDLGEVPFIEFPNNDNKTSDLDNVKPLIDVYDKVYSGYVNDIEDIQEVIFVLTNYGGTDLNEFLGGLKRYKTVDMQSSGADDKSGLSTITIDIPVEARNNLLDRTRKSIFVQGQGVDPEQEKFGNTSGEALKYMYGLLELKCGLMETEFRLAYGKLIRMICRYLNYTPKKITQTWTRNAIKNDLETSEIAKNSMANISKKTIVKNHPWVDDPTEELKQIEEEKSVISKYSKALEGDDDE